MEKQPGVGKKHGDAYLIPENMQAASVRLPDLDWLYEYGKTDWRRYSMNANGTSGENITVTQKIVFLSYRQELYEKFRLHLTGQYDIFYHRIREDTGGKTFLNEIAVLYIIEMLHFTEKSAELLHEIRSKCSAPILFLSDARTEKIRTEETVRAIRGGADGYLANRQPMEEIMAEAEALIRLQTRIQKRPERWIYQELQIVPDRRQVFLNGKEISLTRLEFDIVQYLAVQNGRAVTYKELYEAVWHSEYLFDDESIMAHIHRIRLKLETDRKRPFYIQNVYGVGYRFGCCCTQKES